MHQLSPLGIVALVTAAKSGNPSSVSRMVLSSNCGLRHHFIAWYVNPPVGSYRSRSESAPGGGFTSAPNEITPRYATWEAPDGWKSTVPSALDAVSVNCLHANGSVKRVKVPVTSPSASLTSSSLQRVGVIDTVVAPDLRPPPSMALYVKEPGVVKSVGGSVVGGR